MAAGYRVEVYENSLVRLIQTGDGNRWIKSKAKKVEHVARGLAVSMMKNPTGALAASHRTTQNRSALGRYQSGFVVSANAYYAAWVHDGTGIHGPRGRYITSDRGMKLPGPNPKRRIQGKHGTVIYRSQGQVAKPWLAEAARIAL
jgi:hypothetical protein